MASEAKGEGDVLGFSYEKYKREKRANEVVPSQKKARQVQSFEAASSRPSHARPSSRYTVLPAGVIPPRGSSPTKTPNARRSRTLENDRIGDYIKGALIGAGTYGRVFLALSSTTGRIMAVKEVELHDKRDAPKLSKEIAMLKAFQHPNIVQYLGSRIEGKQMETILIFTEWLPGGSLKSVYKSFNRLPTEVVRLYTTHILCGLKYLHDKGVAHRDLKCDNVLISDSGMAKLADFGQAVKRKFRSEGKQFRIGEEDRPEIIGTPYFMAPEVISQTVGFDALRADIWSLGCLILEMATSKAPWHERGFKSLPQLFLYVATEHTATPAIPDELPNTLQLFISSCVCREPKDRPSCGHLLGQRFVLGR
jgi:serine/threonine protein kinase